jgi:hypothetical protein
MAKKLLYANGYLIRVTSWENDGDNEQTKEILIVTEQRAKQIVKFCWLFAGDIGNAYDPDEKEIAKINSVLINFYHDNPDFFDETPEDTNYISDWMIEFAYDLGLSGGDYYTRACDTVEVLRFDQDVYCDDLSSEFKD